MSALVDYNREGEVNTKNRRNRSNRVLYGRTTRDKVECSSQRDQSGWSKQALTLEIDWQVSDIH